MPDDSKFIQGEPGDVEKNESPREHLERLFKTYRVYTVFDSKHKGHESAVNMIFVQLPLTSIASFCQ